jgi:hypothetical protein
MSDLLNDSATAVKVRDKLCEELYGDEEVFYATDGNVAEPFGIGGRELHLMVGAIIVTDRRLLVAEAKMLGRASF